MRAFAPNGLRILGTLETLSGRAEILEDTFERDKKGNLSFEYGGYTEVFWDDQQTVEKDGRDIFLDEEGGEWTEDELVLEESPDATADAITPTRTITEAETAEITRAWSKDLMSNVTSNAWAWITRTER